MKKFLGIFLLFFITTTSAFSAEMRFVQVDGALYNNASNTQFEKLIEKINAEKNIKFVVFTGNNISKSNDEILKSFLKKAKKLKSPYYVVLGQKDVYKQKGLSKEEYVKILNKKAKAHRRIKSPNYVFTKNKVVFIVADGSKEFMPSPIGYYRENVLLWLDEQLDKYEDKNVVILQHYPIIPPAKKETYYTYKADEYLQLLSEHKNVKAVISGHFNVNNEQMKDGILHISTQNAPAYRVIDILDYETENPQFWSVIKD